MVKRSDRWQKRVYLVDVAGAGTAYDITPWVSAFPTSENAKTYGQVSTLKLVVRSSRMISGVPSTLPVIPVGGMEVMYYDHDTTSANAHTYYFGGRIVKRGEADDPDGKLWLLTMEGFDRELNTHVPYLGFDQATYPNDSSRVTALIQNAGLQGTWDATTYVASGGFVTYPSGATSGYYHISAYEILQQLAADPGTNAGSPVAGRRWHIHCEWSDPANPGAGGTGAIKRFFNYYSGSQVAQELVPLTDRADGKANYVADAFGRAASTTSAGSTDTGQPWTPLNGSVWGVSAGGTLYLLPGTWTGIPALVVESGIADCDVIARIVNQAADTPRVLARVTPGGTGGWQGYFLQTSGGAGTQYTLKYWNGTSSSSVVGALGGSAANNDLVRLSFKGRAVSLYVTPQSTGIEALAFSATTGGANVTATQHGLAANSATGVPQFDDFRVNAVAAKYDAGWVRNLDYTALMNIVAIEGPGSEPAAVTWTGATNVSTSDGQIAKTASTSAWDAGAFSNEVLTDDGGYVQATIDHFTLCQATFTNPDVEALPDAETGGSWNIRLGDWHVRSNAAGLNNRFTGKALATLDPRTSTCIVRGVIGTYADKLRLVFRLTDDDNYYFLETAGSGTQVKLRKRQATAESDLSSTTVTVAAGTELKVVLTDTLVQVYVGGVFKFNYTISGGFNVGATKHGIGADAAVAGFGGTWDTFTVDQTYAERVFGLTYTGYTNTLTGLPYGIHLLADRSVRVQEGASDRGAFGSYGVGDAFKVECRKEVINNALTPVVKYYRKAVGTANWALLYTSTVTPTQSTTNPFYVGASFYHPGASLSGVTLRRFTYGVYQDAASIALYKRWWAKKVISDPSLDTDAKRSARAMSLFARYSGPRDQVEITSRQAYRPGRLVLYNNAKLGWTDRQKLIASAQRDWGANKNLSYPQFKYLLGDSDVEYGDDQALGFLLKGTPEDRQGPPAPLGLTPTSGQRDGATTVLQRFTWVQDTTHGEQYVELEAAPVDSPSARTRALFPASQNYGWVGQLQPGRGYTGRVRARDYNGNPGDWSPQVNFVAVAIGASSAPTWVGYNSGIDIDGTAWVETTWRHPQADHTQYRLFHNTYPNPLRKPPFDAVPGDQTSAYVRGLAPGSSYAFMISAIDYWGVPGAVSTVLIVVRAGSPAPSGDGPPAPWPEHGWDTSHPDDPFCGWALVDASLSSLALDTTTAYKGGTSLAVTSTAIAEVRSLPFPAVAGAAYGTWSALTASVAGNSALDAVRWYTKAGVFISQTTLWAGDPGTGAMSAAKEHFFQATAPASTAYGIRTLVWNTSAGGGAGTMYAAWPAWRVVAASTDIGAGAITASKIGSGAVGNAQLGIITDVSRFALRQTPGTERGIFDDTGTQRGTEFYSPASGYIRYQGMFNITNTGMFLSSSSGDSIDLSPSGGISLSGTAAVTISPGAGVLTLGSNVTTAGVINIGGGALTVTAAAASTINVATASSGGNLTINTGSGIIMSLGQALGGALGALSVTGFISASGTTSQTTAFTGIFGNFTHTGWNTIGSSAAVRGTITLNNTTTASQNFQNIAGLYSTLVVNAANLTTFTNGYGVRAEGTVSATTAATFTTWYGIFTKLTVATNATITTAYGARINSPVFSGTTARIGTNYGIYIDTQINASGYITTATYALYSAGGQVYINTGAVGTVGLVIDGATGQSANLLQAQVAGSPVFSIDKDGQVLTGRAVALYRNGGFVERRGGVNLIEGSNVTLSAVDDPTNNRVNVTINASGVGGSSSPASFATASKWSVN